MSEKLMIEHQRYWRKHIKQAATGYVTIKLRTKKTRGCLSRASGYGNDVSVGDAGAEKLTKITGL